MLGTGKDEVDENLYLEYYRENLCEGHKVRTLDKRGWCSTNNQRSGLTKAWQVFSTLKGNISGRLTFIKF